MNDKMDGIIYMKLLSAHAFDKQSAASMDDLGIKSRDLKRLLDDERVRMYRGKVYLTDIGWLCAAGEFTMRIHDP